MPTRSLWRGKKAQRPRLMRRLRARIATISIRCTDARWMSSTRAIHTGRRVWAMSEKDGELELTPGYRISIPLTHVDGPEERELLRRRHPPHPDIPRNLIAQGWFERGYDTAALEFWDVVHEANRELAARDAEISSLRDQLRRVEGERDEAQRQCGELHEHLALMVRYLEEEASEGDGIAEQHWDGYQGAKSVLMRTAPNRAAWETGMVAFAELQKDA